MTLALVAVPLWLACGLLILRERSLYARQSRAARALERWVLRGSPPILVAAPRVLRWLLRPGVLGEAAVLVATQAPANGRSTAASPSASAVPSPPMTGVLATCFQTNGSDAHLARGASEPSTEGA